MTRDELADELQTLHDKILDLQNSAEEMYNEDPDNYAKFGVKKSLATAQVAISYACELMPKFPSLGGLE